MIEHLIYFFTAFLGFTVISIIQFRYKFNKNTNLFFILFLLLGSFHFLAHGLSIFINSLYFLKFIDLFFLVLAAPLIYLYYCTIINNHYLTYKKIILHFIAPCLVILIFYFKVLFKNESAVLGYNLTFILIVLPNLFYTYITYKLLQKKVWNRNSDILIINQQNSVIKKWTKMLFILFSFMLLIFIINLSINKGNNWYVNQNHYSWLASLIWIGMYFKILVSPEFLYGYEVLQNKIKEYNAHSIVFNNIWQLKPIKQITNVQDLILIDKIVPNLVRNILDIENLALNTNIFFSDKFDFSVLANKLSIPKSNLLFIFKYHALISFNDFRKIIRIQRAIILIEEGFLKINTTESLAEKVGFSTYSSFFKSFKSITGHSPKEYSKI